MEMRPLVAKSGLLNENGFLQTSPLAVCDRWRCQSVTATTTTSKQATAVTPTITVVGVGVALGLRVPGGRVAMTLVVVAGSAMRTSSRLMPIRVIPCRSFTMIVLFVTA